MNLNYENFNMFIEVYNSCNDKTECQNIIRRICLDIFKNEKDNFNGCVLDQKFLIDFSKGLLTDFLNLLFDINKRDKFTLELLNNNSFIDYITNNADSLSAYNKINDFNSASDFIKNDILKYISNSIMSYMLKLKPSTINDTQYEKNGC